MKINEKITANKMVGSLCGYTTYRNYFSNKKINIPKGIFFCYSLEDDIIGEVLFYTLKLMDKFWQEILFKNINYVNIVQNSNLILFCLGNKSFLAFLQDYILPRNVK